MAGLGNPANLAPRFTSENAREMQRRALESRLAREAREKAEELEKDIAARARIIAPDPDERRKQRVQKQIDSFLDAMEKTDDVDKKRELGRSVSDLWKLVQATAGQLRPGRARRESAPMLAEAQPMPSIPAPVPAAVSSPTAQNPIAPTSQTTQPQQPVN